MQELKLHPRAKLALIFVLGMIVIVLISISGFGISDSSNQIPTAKAEYFPTADGNWMIQNMIPLTKNLYGVACSNSCFGVGESGAILKIDLVQISPRWLIQPSFTTKTLRGIICLSPTNCYAVGGDGTANSGEIWNYDGTNWSLQVNNIGSLNAVGCIDNNCFAFGQNGLIYKRTGNTWAAVNSSTTNTLNSFACYSSTLCFAVGAGGTILNYDSNSWSNGSSGVTANLNGVGCNAFFALCMTVGNNGTILKYNGTNWSPQLSGTTNDLNDVYCTFEKCYAVGNSGIMIKYASNIWTFQPSITSHNLNNQWCYLVIE